MSNPAFVSEPAAPANDCAAEQEQENGRTILEAFTAVLQGAAVTSARPFKRVNSDDDSSGLDGGMPTAREPDRSVMADAAPAAGRRWPECPQTAPGVDATTWVETAMPTCDGAAPSTARALELLAAAAASYTGPLAGKATGAPQQMQQQGAGAPASALAQQRHGSGADLWPSARRLGQGAGGTRGQQTCGISEQHNVRAASHERSHNQSLAPPLLQPKCTPVGWQPITAAPGPAAAPCCMQHPQHQIGAGSAQLAHAAVQAAKAAVQTARESVAQLSPEALEQFKRKMASRDRPAQPKARQQVRGCVRPYEHWLPSWGQQLPLAAASGLASAPKTAGPAHSQPSGIWQESPSTAVQRQAWDSVPFSAHQHLQQLPGGIAASAPEPQSPNNGTPADVIRSQMRWHSSEYSKLRAILERSIGQQAVSALEQQLALCQGQ
jgi:hypothetical protein